LTDRAKALVAKLDPAKSHYKDIKEALLREYKLNKRPDVQRKVQ